MNTTRRTPFGDALGRVRMARFNAGVMTVLLTLLAGPAGAQMIVEIFPGTVTSPQAQYVVLRMYAAGQNRVAGRAITVHNAIGTEIARYTFPANVPNGANQAWILIATPQAEQFFGVQADLEMSAILPAAGGKVCFGGAIDCVAWGAYTGSTVGVGRPFNQNGPWRGGQAAIRYVGRPGVFDTLDAADDTDDCAKDFEFFIALPINNAYETASTIPVWTCGNGKVEFMEQCDDGNTVDGDACNSYCSTKIPTVVSPAFADFNADGRSDVPWRNIQTGANVIWRSAVSTTQQPTAAVNNLSWRVVGVGDFDNSGKADLVWRNFATGANVIWREGIAASQRALPTVPLAWNIVAVGDWNGDFDDDLMWRNSATGQNQIWPSGVPPYPRYVFTTVGDQQWRILALADFDGDKQADLLWRNFATGANMIWRAAGSTDILPVATVGLAWSAAGIGDFDGDGQEDILWRNTTTGANVIWRSAMQSKPIAVANTSTAWRVVAVGDYNGDRRDDILWRNSITGANAIWRSGSVSTPQAMTGVTNQLWHVVP